MKWNKGFAIRYKQRRITVLLQVHVIKNEDSTKIRGYYERILKMVENIYAIFVMK